MAVPSVFVALCDTLSHPACATDEQGLIVFGNAALRAMLRQSDPGGKSLGALLKEAAAGDPVWRPSDNLPAHAGAPSRRRRIQLHDGREYDWSARDTDSPDQKFTVHIFEPVVPATEEDQPARDLIRISYEHSPLGFFVASADLGFIHINPAAARILGHSRSELMRLTLYDFVRDPEVRASTREQVERGIGSEGIRLEVQLPGERRANRWVSFFLCTISAGPGAGSYVAGLVEDYTDRRAQRELEVIEARQLALRATIDQKTGLYNHAFMHEFLGRRIAEARRSNQVVSVLMLDVDNFRRINSQHGHDCGDLALLAVAQVLQESLREEDVACRFGGEEFVLVLAGAGHEAACRVAERIRTRMERLRPIPGRKAPVTGSIGVATFPSHASTAPSLLKAADMALFDAKRRGRNQVVSFDDCEQHQRLPGVDQIEKSLRDVTPEAVEALITAIDLRDRYTGAHCQRVRQLALRLGEAVGLSQLDLELIDLAAPLLDIGKIGLPDSILLKASPLTPDELQLMRMHPEWGDRMLRGTSIPDEARQLVRWHHERLDGSGYPDRLTAPEQPPVLRVVAVADVAAALRGHRPHRDAWPRSDVHAYLADVAGSQLDEDVVAAYRQAYPA